MSFHDAQPGRTRRPAWPEQLTAVLKSSLPMRVRLAWRSVRDTVLIGARDLRWWNAREADLAPLYARAYHDERGYTASAEEERAIKDAHAAFVVRATGARKVLVAGCSAGDLLRSLERVGIEAWGFDISPDLFAFCGDDLRDRVRHGSMTAIPYGPEDGFDAVVATDVFEHVPRRSVGAMVRELRRLESPSLVTLIDHVSLRDPGHVTLMPLVWWRVAFRGAYRLRPSRGVDRTGLPVVYGLDPADRHHVLRVWDRS